MHSIKNNFTGIIRKLLFLTLIIIVATPLYSQVKDKEKNPCPGVIPALREWKGLTGSYDVESKKEICIAPDYYGQLESTAQCFVEDLSFLGISDFLITKSEKRKGAISITLDCTDDLLGNEGYRIEIDKGISIVANTPKGVFMGSRTVLQLINIYGNKIPKGMIRDYPKYQRRGFMLDVGRKFFKLEFLENYVKILSYYKMNEFQIHLNDNGFKQFFENDWAKTYSAFRLESETYPGLTATDGSYSKKEFRELQKLGKRYGVNIIPEIDAPAHSLAFTKYLPGIGSQKYGIDHLDISKKETYDFLNGLFDEYLGGDDPVFIGTDVHIGTDEYSKEEAEAFRAFTDFYIKKVQSYGKRARVWGALTHAEGITPVSSDNVIMNAWYNGYADPAEMIKQGYELITTSDRHLYIVPAAGYYYDYLNLEFLLDKWEPNLIGGDTFPMGHPQISGGMFAVWNDHCGNGISEKDVHHRAFPALQTLAQKMWHGGDKDLNIKEFMFRSSALAEAPGINVMGKIPHEGDTVLHYDFTSSKDKDLSVNSYDVVNCKPSMWKNNQGLKFDVGNHIVLPVEEIGYPYKVSLEISVKQLDSERVLFSSSNAELVLNPKDDKIEIGFKRDGYFYSFSNLLDKNKKLKLAISGDHKGTSLFIDGKEVERLEGRVEEYRKEDGRESNMFIQQTLVFPLREIGGFEGILYELTVISE